MGYGEPRSFQAVGTGFQQILCTPSFFGVLHWLAYLISELDMTCKAPWSVVECTHLPP